MTQAEGETTQQALDVARALASAGIPVFVAPPNARKKIGYDLPVGWQHLAPDPRVVDLWQPGMALCAVMGYGLDVLDLDPRNGANLDAMDVQVPTWYAAATTPSRGMHLFVRSMGCGSHDNVFPGIDVKSGRADGGGRGFAFLAPTERPSKDPEDAGAVRPYAWVTAPDVARLTTEGPGDVSGAQLAAKVTALLTVKPARRRVEDDGSMIAQFLNERAPQSAAAATKAIDKVLAEVARWTSESEWGFRKTLMRAALTLGGYVGAGFLDQSRANALLVDVVEHVWPVADEDDQDWIEQGLTDGAARPFSIYTPEQAEEWEQAQRDALLTDTSVSEPDGIPPTELADSAAVEEPSLSLWNPYEYIGVHAYDPVGCKDDTDHAEFLAERVAPVLRYGEDSRLWLTRRRDRWVESEDLSDWALTLVSRLMPEGDPDLPKKKDDYTAANWTAWRRAKYRNSATSSPIGRKFTSLGRNGAHLLSVNFAELDSNPDVLWAGGVPWDLRASGEVPTPASWIDRNQPHRHTARYTPQIVPTLAWDHYIATVWPDPEMRAWGLRVLSICLTGYADEALPILFGPTRAGKSQTIWLLSDVLGTYSGVGDVRLLSGVENAHASIIYALKGLRMAVIDEGPRKGHLAEERLKQLTGGLALTGNPMRGNPITFAATHTLVMTTNDEPQVTDPALRERMRILPCTADADAVRAARRALTPSVWRAEAPGVFAMFMRECAGWLADRESARTTRAPAFVHALVQEVAYEQNHIQQWLDQRTEPCPVGTRASELLAAANAWLQAEYPDVYRRSPWNATSFGLAMRRAGIERDKRADANYYLVRMRGQSVAGVTPFPTGQARQWVGPATAAIGRAGPDGGVQGPQAAPAQGKVELGKAKDAEVVAPTLGGVGAEVQGGPASDLPDSKPQVNHSFSSMLDSLDGRYCSITNTTKNNYIHKDQQSYYSHTGERGQLTLPPAKPASAGATASANGVVAGQPAFSEPTPLGEPPAETTQSIKSGGIVAGQPPFSAPHELADPPKPLRSRLTPEEKAARAEARKAERAEAKAAQRRERIEEAAGERFDLAAGPLLVDRAGRVTQVRPADAAEIVRLGLAVDGALTVDVETSGYPVGHEHYRLRTVQLGNHALAAVFHPEHHADEIRVLLDQAPRLHAHSATADLVPLARAGLIDAESAWSRMHDTVIPAKLADPASTGSDPGLKQVSAARLGAHAVSPAADEARAALFKAAGWLTNSDAATDPQRCGWAQVDSGCETMARYAASDVLDTAALAVAPPPIPVSSGATADRVVDRERAVQAMTARIALHGLPLDGARITRLRAEHTDAREQAAAKLAEWGVKNPGSPQQVAAAAAQMGAALPLTVTGKPSASASALEALRGAEGALGEFVGTVLAHRHHATALGLFLEPFDELVHRGDGRVRSTIYTLGTDTGRMSSTRFNLQQLPREGGIRACITADPGHLLLSADFSGVELRVAAALSEDESLRQILADGRDLHWEVARMVFGESATKADRYNVKRAVFGRLYGGGIPTLARQTGVSESVIASVVDSLDAMTPGLAAWSAKKRSDVQQGITQFQTYSGRVIHLPRDFPHKAPNFCIQGTARELTVDALLDWAQTPWGECVLWPVHDEIDVMVPEADAEAATAELVRCMTRELHGVKIVAEADPPSRFWADSV